MALTWSIEKVENYEELWVEREDGQYLNGLTEALIWTTMTVGLGTVTEKNIPEWLLRLDVLSGMGLDSLVDYKDGERTYRTFTVEELHRHRGLSTNVGPETRQKWFARHAKFHLQDKEKLYSSFLSEKVEE